jgi:hypothetical protein
LRGAVTGVFALKTAPLETWLIYCLSGVNLIKLVFFWNIFFIF